MKKLLNVICSKWFAVVLCVVLALMFAVLAVRDVFASGEKARVLYDYRDFNSFKDGMPDYGIRNRKNILPQ